jgi:hypothetical protein
VSFTPEKPETPLKPGETDAESMETMMHRQQQRMQAVLRDRFGMKLRMETRELPIYALTIAKRRSQLKDPETAGKGELTVSGRICGCWPTCCRIFSSALWSTRPA